MQFFINNVEIANAIREMMKRLNISSYTAFIYFAIKILKDSDPIACRLPLTVPVAKHIKPITSKRHTLNSVLVNKKVIGEVEAIMLALGIDSTTTLLYEAVDAVKASYPELADIVFEPKGSRGRPVLVKNGLIPLITNGKYECPICHKHMTRQGWHQHGCRGE